jgi:hypothetical protein
MSTITKKAPSVLFAVAAWFSAMFFIYILTDKSTVMTMMDKLPFLVLEATLAIGSALACGICWRAFDDD